MERKIFALFLTLLFALAIFPTAVNALYYRVDVNNGSWSQYTGSLASTYYAPDTGKTLYNRSFEDLNFGTIIADVNTAYCDSYFCTSSTTAGNFYGTYRTTDFAHAGTYSVWAGARSGGTTFFFSNNEILGDTNVTFWAISQTVGGANQATYGYMDDQNKYTSVGSMATTDAGVWKQYSYVIPRGHYRMAYKFSAGADAVYLDDVTVTRNNTGTFTTNSPEFCSSISACGNIGYHLPAAQLEDLYWVVDYVPGASCLWDKNGVFQGSMTEGAGGMYYALVNASTASLNYLDVNLGASCSKIPFADKSFLATPELYRYGNVPNGSFETGNIDINTLLANTAYCSNEWCAKFTGTNEIVATNVRDPNTTNPTLFRQKDGSKALYVRSGASTTTLWANHYAGGASVSFWVMPTNDAASTANYGYVNDNNTFTSVGVIQMTLNDWNYITYSIPAGSNRPAWTSAASDNFILDEISSSNIKKASSMVTDNNLSANFGLRGTNYAFNASYKDGLGDPITDANCTLTIDATPYTMNYDAGIEKYVYATAFISDGNYSISFSCVSTVYTTQTDAYQILITVPSTQSIVFTPIENINGYTLSEFSPRVDILSLTNQNNNVVWSSRNLGNNEYTVTYHIFSTLKSTKQYFLFTSADGVNWVFDDTINYTPIQKIPTNTGYEYSFTHTLNGVETKYFKLVLISPPLAWGTIQSQNYWNNINPPSPFTDTNGHTWDLFQDSNFSNIQSYTTRYFGDLVGTNITTGYELQFTAYASQATTLKAGFRVGSTDYTSDVTLTTSPVRYSVNFDTNNFSSQILFKSTNTSSARVYISDYAIVPRSYFVERINVTAADGSVLPAIINDGASTQYIQEGRAFRAVVQAWDVNADTYTLRLEALLGGTVVKSFDTDLSDLTSQGATLTLNNLYDGIIDLNGTASNPSIFRTLTIKATIINASGNSVATQYKSIALVQYPYFGSDLTLSAALAEGSVGQSPAFDVTITQQAPSTLLGLIVNIFDENHSTTNPNYVTTIFSSQLNCQNTCSKHIVLDDYVWEKSTNYRVYFSAILNTQAQNYDDLLTTFKYAFPIGYRQLETARVFQVFERTDFAYTASEQIPLVLQARDNPFRDMHKDVTVRMQIGVCTGATGANCDYQTTLFSPSKFIYDQATGYNYWYFNNFLYKDNGAAIPDGNYISINVTMTSTNKLYQVPYSITATRKCLDSNYGSAFNPLSFLMNTFSDTVVGCSSAAKVPPLIVQLADGNETRILVQNSRVVTGGQNASVACIKTDANALRLNADLVCAIWYKRNEQQIDGFNISLGNDFTDYSKTGTEGQRIAFSIPAEVVMFNDPIMMQKALEADYQTTPQTLGEFVSLGFDKVFSGYANPITSILTGATRDGLITNVGLDINWDKTFDPTFANGLFFVKISGIGVTNQYDYLVRFPELAENSPTYFMTFANDRNLGVTIPKATVSIIGNDMKEIQKQILLSPLVINEAPSTAQQTDQTGDVNTARGVIPAQLPFKYTVDMISNNFASDYRVFVPLIFTYAVPDKTSILDLILHDPAKFALQNWFIFLIIFVLVLGISLMYRNFKGNSQGS